MALTFDTQKSIDDISGELAQHYPELIITRKRKSTVYIRKGKIMAVVRLKNNVASVHGDLNLKNPLIIVLICIGILLTIVGIIIVFIILYSVYNKEINSFKQEIFDYISY